MSNLGSLYYSVFLKDMTDADFQKINKKFENLGYDIKLTPKILKEMTQDAVPKGIKIELDPRITSEALQKAVENKTMKVAVTPLLTGFREAIVKATKENPPLAEIGVQEAKLRSIIQNVLNKQGFMLNISTVNDNYSKAIQQKLNGRKYTVTIHADANEITRSVQASLMQVQSRYFGLQVSKDILRRSIDEALMGKPFPIQIAVMPDQARRAVQNALNNARMVGKDDALAYQRLQTGELRAAQAELARLRAAHQSAADAAKTHTSASISLGGALGSNIKIAGELGAAMASLYSIHAAKQFLSHVIEIGGELEHQKIALETIYGTESKMGSLYGQIKGLARQSPFGVMELTKNVKQLSAYGVAYNEVYDTAKRLADISAATSVDIQRLILAFGKTKNRTFLDGLEAKQFAYANIPIYDALSKKLTELEGKFVSVKDVMGRIKKREIGFDMVKEILWDMTDEGGKFYNMQEKLAGSVKTSWKLVRDNIELMFGEIAESGVGDFLKSIGQTLQEVTRSWKALATVIGVGSGAFAVYKLAVMGTNALLHQETGAIVANHLAEKQRQATNLRTIGLTQHLDAEEKNLIATRKRLTAVDLQSLVAKKQLSNESIKQLYLTGKISRAELQEAVALGVVTQKEFEQIAGTNALNGAWLRFRATMTGTWATIKSGVASAFGMIFNWTTAAFAAIAGITYLIQHNNEENKIADDFSKTWKQKGEDVAKELSETLKKPFENLTAPQADQLIEEYKNKIRDFATLPEDVITRAIYDKDGKILDTTNQIKNLRKELETLQQTAEGMNLNLGTVINATGDGIFNEDLITNLKDWQKDFNSLDAAVLKFVNDNKDRAKEIVKTAADASPAYAEEIKNIKNLNEQLAVLMRNRTKYKDAWEEVTKVDKWGLRGGSFLGSLWKTITFQSTPNSAAQWNTLSANNAIKDLKDAIEGFKNTHDDWDWDNLTEAQEEEVRQFFKKIIETAEISSPELKTTISNIFENAFGVDFISQEEAQQKIADALNKGLEAEVGKAIFEKLKNGLKLTPEEQSKVDEALYKIYQQLYQKAPEAQKKALEQAMTESDGNGGVMFSRKKMMTIQAKLDVRADWKQWQREIDDATGNLPDIQTWVKGATDIPSFIKAVQEGYKTAKTTLDQLKPLMLKAGIEFDFGEEIYTGPMSLYAGMTDTQKAMIDQYNEGIRAIKAAKKAGDEFGFDYAEEYNKKHKEKKNKGFQKDPFADAIKERIKILKEAKKEYEDLAKSIGTDAAYNELKDSPIFAGLKANEFLPEQTIPKTIADYKKSLDELQEKLTAKGLKTQKHRELNIEIEKVKFEIKKKETEDALKLALDNVSKEAERQIADWNLFDKIRKTTGNQNLAMSIAFGMNATAETDYPAMVKKQFADLAKELGHDLTFDNTTLEEARKLGDDIAKSYQDTASKLEKYAREQKDAIADILNEYQSLSDKLVKIDADRERKIKTVRESDMSDADKAKYIQRINVEADYQKFTQSNEYLQFFGGIYALTMQQAQKIGDLIEENLNRKLQAGAISAEDYYKEIERVRQQLDKLRKIKSNALTFMTEGFKGLNKKEQEENDSKRLETIQKIKDLEEKVAEAKAKVKGIDDTEGHGAVMQAQAQLLAAKKELEIQNAIHDKLVKNQQQMENLLGVINVVNSMVNGLSDAFNSIKEMAESFGVDTGGDDWLNIGGLLDSLSSVTSGISKAVQSALNGDIGGILSGVISTITSPFTIWADIHDKKLQEMIERSKEYSKRLQAINDAIERRMANYLGNAKYLRVDQAESDIARLEELRKEQAKYEAMAKSGGLDSYLGKKYLDEIEMLERREKAYKTGGAYGYQRQMMKEQQEELKKQKAALEDMKNPDSEAIAELEAQIDQAEIEIREFAEEVAKDLYGIDLKDWAAQLGDALFDAWKKGEDGAEAFKKKAGEILGEVMNKIFRLKVLEPMMEQLADDLFGKDGESGIFGEDFELTSDDVLDYVADRLVDIGDAAADFNDFMDNVEKRLDERYGLSMKGDSESSSNMTKGLQSLTENTGDLLASYVNDGRASLSVIRTYLENYFNSSLPQMNVIAESQLQAQKQIAENTLRTAEAAEAINTAMDLVTRNQDRLERSWRRIAEKNWGTY